MTAATRFYGLAALVCAAAYLALLVPAVAAPLDGLRPGLWIALKAAPVALMIGWLARHRAPGAYRRWIIAGLSGSLLGDVLLVLPGDGFFIAGLSAFLVAHLLYIVAFTGGGPPLRLLRALPFVAWTGAVFAHLWPGLGGMALPVGAYCVAISAMLWRATARLNATAPDAHLRRLAAAGAIAFALSDTLIALDRFGEPIAHVGFPIMILYWLGQLGIAASVGEPRPDDRRAGFSGGSGPSGARGGR